MAPTLAASAAELFAVADFDGDGKVDSLPSIVAPSIPTHSSYGMGQEMERSSAVPALESALGTTRSLRGTAGPRTERLRINSLRQRSRSRSIAQTDAGCLGDAIAAHVNLRDLHYGERLVQS
jgi:hypothetical protein